MRNADIMGRSVNIKINNKTDIKTELMIVYSGISFGDKGQTPEESIVMLSAGLFEAEFSR